MPPPPVKFGEFELDPAAFELRWKGRAVRLERLPLEMLLLMVSRKGELVSRADIVDKLWGSNVHIDTNTAVNVVVRKVRQALRDDPDSPRFLLTVPGKGYRFVGTLVEEGQSPTTFDAIETEPLPPVENPVASPLREEASAEQLRYPYWIVWAAVGLLVLMTAILLRPYQRRPTSPPARRIMLAILPFQNLGNDPGQEYFSDGLTEETINDLGQLSPEHLGVIARTSVMAYKHTDKTIGQIGSELGVDYILEGSVRRDGGRVRITAQLIRVSDQTHLWARNYDRELKDLIEVQNDLGQAIAEQVQAKLTLQREAELSGRRTVNPAAYDAYLRGLESWDQRSKEGFRQAITDFTTASELDPNFAPAFSGLARIYSLAPIFAGIPASEAAPRALEAANRALTLDGTLADAHIALAFVKGHYQHDWSSAEREFRRAIELEPNNPYGHLFYSNSYLSPFGRHEEAIVEMKKAMELDPLSTPIQSFAGRTFTWARQYDDALAQFQKVNQLDPNFAVNHERLAQLYALLARFDDAIAEETKARMLAGEKPQSVLEKMNLLRGALATRGAQGYWEGELRLALGEPNPPEAYVRPYGLAMIYGRLGDKDKAFANLEIAYGDRDTQMTELAIEPQFDPLRSDPRFVSLLQRMGIPGP